MSRYWYAYLGGSGTQPQLNPANYRLLPEDQLVDCKPTCFGVNEICAVLTPAGGTTPFSPFSQNIQNYIIAALSNTSITQFPQFPSKAYVFKKD